MFVPRNARGMTLVDVLVGSAVALIIFLAVFQLLRASALISTLAAETAASTAIMNTQMEYIRSLPYDSVGTVGGIPAGLIAQYATTTEDNVNYSVRTFIDYYDDPMDGTGTSDSNGITTDYKRAKVSVSFTTTTGVHTVSSVSNISPPGVETTTGGGTLRVSVVNSASVAVPGATVMVVNPGTTPAVNLSTFTDATGVALLPGAFVATGYQVTVSKTGYSTAKTYDRDTTNQNPSPGHLTVVKNQTTSGTFAIDLLSSFTLQTYLPIASSTFSDTFTDASQLTAMSNVSVAGGVLTLTGDGLGGYLSPGSARSVTTAPALLAHWGSANATLSVPAGSALIHVVDGSGALIPDAALPGNGAGFSAFPVNLYALSTTTYPALALRADLTAGAAAPAVQDWSLSYATGPTPLPGIPFTLTGAKTIGSTGAGAPIYKTISSGTTDAAGSAAATLEWDTYALSVPGYDIIDACPMPPYNVLAGTDTVNRLVIGSSTSNALLVSTKDASGNVLANASVTLSRTGFTKTVSSSACGTAYFGGVSSASDYSLSAASGTLTASYTNVQVSGFSTYAAILQ